jgi:VanZ family protein
MQLFSSLRIASVTDLLMNSISGAVGACAGTLCGIRVWRHFNTSLNLRRQNNPIDILTLLFGGLIAADSLSPYLPTLLLSQVWRSIKASNFDPIAGLAQHPWHSWLVTHVMVYMVFTLMVSQWQVRGNLKVGILNTGVVCGLFALILECSKLFIASRVMNSGNIVANLCGILLAALLLRFWPHPVSSRVRLSLGILGLTAYILYIGWEPFNFTYSPETFATNLPHGVEFLPFYHYAMGASLNHVRLFVQTIIFSTALIYFVRLFLNHTGQHGRHIFIGILISGGIGILQEGGQLFLPSRTPSMTDIYCYMLGGLLATRVPLFYAQGENRKVKYEVR